MATASSTPDAAVPAPGAWPIGNTPATSAAPAGPRRQSYANHRRYHPLLLAAPVFVAYVVSTVVWAAQDPDWRSVIHALFALVVGLSVIAARRMVIAVQDRVIRLEMRLRLVEVLPSGLRPRIGELGLRQLIALRFAADAELPDLVARTLAGELSDPDAIKRAVRDWQPDHLRA